MVRKTLNLYPDQQERNPQYEDDPQAVNLNMAVQENVADFNNANPGQWFYGVVDTLNGNTYLVAGDVHDEPQNAQQQNARMLNTYASKPEGPFRVIRNGDQRQHVPIGWLSLADQAMCSAAERFNGIKSDPTGHQAVCRLYRLNNDQCLGFRVIKINERFGSFSDRSNSLNANKPDQRVVQTVSAAGPEIQGVTQLVQSPAGWKASPTARMPPQWANAMTTFLTQRLGILNWAIDF